MSLGDFLRKQLIDVIQWTEEGDGVLAYRYPMRDMEIQYGARLTVRESQMALFVNEGKIADQFVPGLYTLETQTLPLAIYTATQVPGGDAQALRLAVFSVAISLAALALSEWLVRRSRAASGHG